MTSVTITSATIENDTEGAFAISSSSGCNRALVKAADKCTVKVKFLKSKTAGSYEGILRINAGLNSKDIGLSASVISPSIEDEVSLLKILEGSSEVSSIDFGIMGKSSTLSKIITLKNYSSRAQAINISLASADFVIQSNNCTASLASKKSCNIKIQAKGPASSLAVDTPVSAALNLGFKIITLDSIHKADVVIPAVLRSYENGLLQDTEINFGSHESGIISKIIQIKNEGGSATSVPVQLSGSDFTLNNQCNNVSLTPNALCQIKISFKASGKSPGSFNSTLSFGSQSLEIKAVVTAVAPVDCSGTAPNVFTEGWYYQKQNCPITKVEDCFQAGQGFALLTDGQGIKTSVELSGFSSLYNSCAVNPVILMKGESITFYNVGDSQALGKVKVQNPNGEKLVYLPPTTGTNKTSDECLVLAGINPEDAANKLYEIESSGGHLYTVHRPYFENGDYGPRCVADFKLLDLSQPFDLDSRPVMRSLPEPPISYIEIPLRTTYSDQSPKTIPVGPTAYGTIAPVEEAKTIPVGVPFSQKIQITEDFPQLERISVLGGSNTDVQLILNGIVVSETLGLSYSSYYEIPSPFDLVAGDVLEIIQTPRAVMALQRFRTLSGNQHPNYVYLNPSKIGTEEVGVAPITLYRGGVQYYSTFIYLRFHYFFEDGEEEQWPEEYYNAGLVSGKTLMFHKFSPEDLGLPIELLDEYTLRYDGVKTPAFEVNFSHEVFVDPVSQFFWSTMFGLEGGNYLTYGPELQVPNFNDNEAYLDIMINIRTTTPFTVNPVIKIPVRD